MKTPEDNDLHRELDQFDEDEGYNELAKNFAQHAGIVPQELDYTVIRDEFNKAAIRWMTIVLLRTTFEPEQIQSILDQWAEVATEASIEEVEVRRKIFADEGVPHDHAEEENNLKSIIRQIVRDTMKVMNSPEEK